MSPLGRSSQGALASRSRPRTMAVCSVVTAWLSRATRAPPGPVAARTRSQNSARAGRWSGPPRAVLRATPPSSCSALPPASSRS
eukprot:3905747-Lingulodinium_polyedra.AAC.1